MRWPWQPAILVLFGSLLCSPLFAYQLALKDGRVVQFQKYRVEAGRFIYTDDAGKEASVAVSDVDLERTRALNAKETPPLDLSAAGILGANAAANAAQGPAANDSEPASLGDAARSLRAQGKAHAAGQKRTYSDDDVQPGGGRALPIVKSTEEEKKSAAGAGTQQAGSKDAVTSMDNREEVSEQDVSEYYDLNREETARSILAFAKLPPSTQFPDRADWEFRLFEAKQDMVQEYMHAKAHPSDEAARKLFAQKWNAFARIANEGIDKATLYLQVHPPK